MKGSISINVIIYVIIGIVIMAALAFAVRDAISNVDNVECAAGEDFCEDENDIIPDLPSGSDSDGSNNPDGGST